MKRGKVCEKHQEFSPDGECRWCEPPPSEVPKRSFAEAARARIEAMKEMMAKGMLYGISSTHSQWGPPPLQEQQAQQGLGAPLPDPNIGPLPVASCKHDGALLDFSGTISCAACGKVISAPVAIHGCACHYPNGLCTCGLP